MIGEGRGGKLCLIASGAYRSAGRGAAHYCASKAGLVLLAQTLALELAEQKINVNVVSPGFIEVGLRPGVSIPYRERIKHDIPWGRFGDPLEVASAVPFLCSPEPEFVSGSVLAATPRPSPRRFPPPPHPSPHAAPRTVRSARPASVAPGRPGRLAPAALWLKITGASESPIVSSAVREPACDRSIAMPPSFIRCTTSPPKSLRPQSVRSY